jgi:hypothetical protein
MGAAAAAQIAKIARRLYCRISVREAAAVREGVWA